MGKIQRRRQKSVSSKLVMFCLYPILYLPELSINQLHNQKIMNTTDIIANYLLVVYPQLKFCCC